tara:strand:+ start:5044 stop:6903 length:1860 start_codon:yes stop_codon:yes gene_type:complete
MELASKILSDITVHMKYAKYIPHKKRRETWDEIVTRNMNMHIRKYPYISDDIEKAYKFVYDKKVLPSMRALQFGGKPIEINPARQYNCAFAPVNDWRVFSEIMFLLLSGCGVGFSVQSHDVEKLPEIRRPNPKRTRRYLVADSIEGWADAVKALIKSYFFGGSTLRFDYGDIRTKGSLLVTSGGKAPGPQPLKECILKVRGILDEKEEGDTLSAIEVHDIVCNIADAVLAGGIRRAALLSLFDADDYEMLAAKAGNWQDQEPQRHRANNSANLMRHMITKEFFDEIWERVQASGCGEPGFYLSNDMNYGCNPCAEIALKPFQFCNLVEINAAIIETQEELNECAKVASFIATLQGGYTDFHYLRDVWRRTTERDALIGVSMTGIASRSVLELDFKEAAKVVVSENERVASAIDINKAARCTTVKPSGTTSLVLGTSSGIHAWFDQFYIRRIRVGKDESIYKYLLQNHPELVEDEYFRPHDTAVISIPQKAPDDAITRDESALHFLKRIKKISSEWVKPGHRKGQNTHNVSATVNIKESEWFDVGEWMWENRKSYNGLTVIPFSDHVFKQAPFEACSKETYEHLVESLKQVDLTKVIEEQDNTDLQGELACAGPEGCSVL